MELVRVEPGSAWLAGRRPFVRLLAEAAAGLGGQLELEAAYGHVGRYTAPDGTVRPIFGNALGLNREAAAMLAADKDYTARLLAGAGLPAVEGVLVFSPAYGARMALKNAAVARTLGGEKLALEAAERFGFPVVLKPNTGSEGRGVHVARSREELRNDLACLFGSDERVRVERFVPGADTRVVVLDGEVRLAYRRMPLAVTGDGERDVRALAEAALSVLASEHRGSKVAADDPRVVRRLAAEGLSLSAVPEAGRVLQLLDGANLSTGGRVEDLAECLPGPIEAMAIRAAEVVGLRLAGVDILVRDQSEGAGGAVVLEVNAAPGLDFYASVGPAQWTRARAVVTAALAG
ncbi:MAG: ATP-grasp domain-containing protein [Pseudomonadota bacterium]